MLSLSREPNYSFDLIIMIEGHVFSVCRFGGGNPELLKAMVAGGHLGMNGIL